MFYRVASRFPAALAALALLTHSVAEAKLVFAHYMIGTVTAGTGHAQTDIDQAISVGIDAFALNVGQPTAAFTLDTVSQLFAAADGTGFKLFFSFDFYQTGDLAAHKTLFDQYRDHPAHLTYGDGSLPVVSSYSGGGLGADAWRSFKQENGVYLLPNAEADASYYSDPAAFFGTWADALDGVLTWETAWPETSETPLNVSSAQDEAIKAAADAAGKTYVMGLSSVQYKHCCGDSWYRAGETNLPERMGQILSLSPEFTEIITWNDAGESHYVGPCWAEGLPPDILEYGNSETNPHAGWQALLASFTAAFKSGAGDARAMAPPAGRAFAGAMWYRSATEACSGDALVPRGAGAAVDAVNWAVVLPPSTPSGDGGGGYTVRVTSGGATLAEEGRPVGPGLHYGSVAGLRAGAQKLELLDASGAVVATAASSVDAADGPNEYGFCNYNYFVVGLQ